jgi:hypothetical protein
MQTIKQAFEEGLIHKLHVARPYDDVAGLLNDAHYDAFAAVSVSPFPGRPHINTERRTPPPDRAWLRL